MKRVVVTVYISGESDEYFSDTVMIYKPHSSFRKKFVIDNGKENVDRISDLIDKFKSEANKDELDGWFMESMNFKTIYIKTDNALLGIQEDKNITDVFDFFRCEKLDFVFFDVGGASAEYMGYRFTVHPNEEIHRNTPHVHVKKCDEEVRYYLDTLERFPKDKVSREIMRDEKKIIIPYLQKNKSKLYRYWNEYINGYIPPMEDADGRQYYVES